MALYKCDGCSSVISLGKYALSVGLPSADAPKAVTMTAKLENGWIIGQTIGAKRALALCPVCAEKDGPVKPPAPSAIVIAPK